MSIRRVVSIAGMLAVSVAACRQKPGAGEESGSRHSNGKPPFEAFRFDPWPGRPGVAPVMPPQSVLIPFRVFINQEKPRQKANPLWRTYAPRSAAELEMASDGRFRCIINPLKVQGRPNDDHTGVEAWVLTRDILCSGDNWQTWTASPHVVVVLADGTMQHPVEQTEIFLREAKDGKVRETTILMRSDERTTGRPPVEMPEAKPAASGKPSTSSQRPRGSEW